MGQIRQNTHQILVFMRLLGALLTDRVFAQRDMQWLYLCHWSPKNPIFFLLRVSEAMCNGFAKSDISLSPVISQPEDKTSHTLFIKHQRGLQKLSTW